MFSKKIKSLLVLGLAMTSVQAAASVVITGTRVVYPENQKNISVQLRNQGSQPSLVQSWISHADEANKTETPFVIVPPLVRVEPNKGQALRIRYIPDATLPKDRESLFYFHVLDVPPKPKNQKENSAVLQFPIQSRLKFFYRPKGLPYDVTEAYAKVTFHLNGKQLVVKNPTPYYITYGVIGIRAKGQKTAQYAKDADMVAPFSETTLALPKTDNEANEVVWSIINDYGGDYSSTSVLNR